MSEREIRVHTPDGEMTTFVVHPDGAGPFPVALLFMDGVGYREQIKENARRFAADGYYVMLTPLTPGVHTVTFGGDVPGVFSTEVTYQITVK